MRYFDKIYIINLEKHKERKERVSAELESVGWTNYEFIEAISGADLPSTTELVNTGQISHQIIDANGILTKNIIACSMSHKKAYKKFLDDGLTTCLILEDDIKFLPVGLKMLLAGGMDRLQNELRSRAWDVFVWGTAHTYQPSWGPVQGCLLLHEYKRYAPEWAAHAYQITRNGAQNLLNSNTPIKYAADVNMESAKNIVYGCEFSLISQTVGEFNKNIANELHANFGDMLYGMIDEYMPSTLETEHVQKNTFQYYQTADKSIKFLNQIRSIQIAGDVDIEKVEWKDHTTPNGDKVLNWAHITLKS